MQMSRQHRSCALSAQAEKLFECLRACDRHLAGKGAAYVGCGAPLHQTSILKERNSTRLCVLRSQSHHLEGPVAAANDVQQGLCVSSLRIADDGNLRLCS